MLHCFVHSTHADCLLLWLQSLPQALDVGDEGDDDDDNDEDLSYYIAMIVPPWAGQHYGISPQSGLLQYFVNVCKKIIS